MTESVMADFYSKSPTKIYKEADKFSKTLERFIDLPMDNSKSKYVKNLAQEKKEEVKFTIEESKYQNEIFRKLEEEDQKRREEILKKLENKDEKKENNLEEKRKKLQKSFERANKKLEQVHKKFAEKQLKMKHQKDEEAIKLRKSLLEFYEKEKLRREKAHQKQVSINPCYGDAINRKEKIQQKNEEFSQKSQKQFMLRMARNSARDKNLLNLSRMKSAQNKRKENIYENNCEIAQQKEHRYIQAYCEDLSASARAYEYRDMVEGKIKQRLHKFFKERKEKWQTHKKRVDEEKSQVSDRCTNIMDRSTKSAFRQTFSSFRDSFKGWTEKVRENKSVIYKRDTQFREKILRGQLDIRLRNTSSFKIEEKMDSMKGKAKILSKDYL